MRIGKLAEATGATTATLRSPDVLPLMAAAPPPTVPSPGSGGGMRPVGHERDCGADDSLILPYL